MPDTMMESVLHQAAIAAVAAHLIQFLKSFDAFAWLRNPMVAKLAGAIAALLGAAGVHWQLQGTLDTGMHIGIDLPSLAVMLEGMEHFVIQWVMQEFYYQQALKPVKA